MKREDKHRKKIESKMSKAAVVETNYNIGSSGIHSSRRRMPIDEKDTFGYRLLSSVAGPAIFGVICFMLIILFSLIFGKSAFENNGVQFGSKSPKFEESPAINDIFAGSSTSTGMFYYRDIDTPKTNEIFAKISCDSVGMKGVDVLYNGTEEALLQGASTVSHSLPGQNGSTTVYGYNTFFEKLKNIGIDDTVKMDTNYGTFVYIVTDIAKSDSEPKPSSPADTLTLYTDYLNTVFDNGNSQYIVITARKASGPEIIK